MTIFNSLGSNYGFRFALRALFARDDANYHKQLQDFLEKKYQGKALLVYKGREALRLALRMISSSSEAYAESRSSRQARTIKPVVGICGFTCFAVYDAIVKEGYDVTYLDIEKDSLHFSYESVKAAYQKNPQLKVLVIQNTLGYPCDIKKIEAFCKEKKIVLIEDLAHSIGTIYADEREAGTVGDVVVLSFSQDKVIDGVSGGALIVRNDKWQMLNAKLSLVNNKRQVIDRVYPLFTFFIRKTYGVGLGKALHFVLRKFHLLSSPMHDENAIHTLPGWYCGLIYDEFVKLAQSLSHRRKIAAIYQSVLGGKAGITYATNLRFPIFVENREGLISFLKKNAIFVSDIWYNSPIGPKKYLRLTNYHKGMCPNAEEVSAHMLNLPTHRNVSEKDAAFITEKVKVYGNNKKYN